MYLEGYVIFMYLEGYVIFMHLEAYFLSHLWLIFCVWIVSVMIVLWKKIWFYWVVPSEW